LETECKLRASLFIDILLANIDYWQRLKSVIVGSYSLETVEMCPLKISERLFKIFSDQRIEYDASFNFLFVSLLEKILLRITQIVCG